MRVRSGDREYEGAGNANDLDIPSVPETLVWGESNWGEAVWGGAIPELLVLDESPLGSGVVAGSREDDVFEEALRIISNGSSRLRAGGTT